MRAPVRHRIELDAVGELHVVLCLEPAALPGLLFFPARGAVTGWVEVALLIGVSCVVSCARLFGLRVVLELESALVVLCFGWLRRLGDRKKKDAAAGMMVLVFSRSSSCPPSPVLGSVPVSSN